MSQSRVTRLPRVKKVRPLSTSRRHVVWDDITVRAFLKSALDEGCEYPIEFEIYGPKNLEGFHGYRDIRFESRDQVVGFLAGMAFANEFAARREKMTESPKILLTVGGPTCTAGHSLNPKTITPEQVKGCPKCQFLLLRILIDSNVDF